MSKDLQMLAAEAALRKMIEDSHFSICTLDKIVRMMGVKPDADAYNILSSLHCVHYNQMQPRLLEALPDLIHKVLSSPSMDASRINVVASGNALRIVKT